MDKKRMEDLEAECKQCGTTLNNVLLTLKKAQLEIAKLDAKNKRLAECCTRRGAQMQKVFKMLNLCLVRENINIDDWSEVIDWFDKDGVPVETKHD